VAHSSPLPTGKGFLARLDKIGFLHSWQFGEELEDDLPGWPVVR
jgi:hypothetical protein